MAEGMITNLNQARGCGFILPDHDAAGRDVYFEEGAVEGTPFAELRLGQRVAFEVAAEARPPQQQQAARVRRLAE